MTFCIWGFGIAALGRKAVTAMKGGRRGGEREERRSGEVYREARCRKPQEARVQ